MGARFSGVIAKQKEQYIAYCVELRVEVKGDTIEEVKANLKEAIEKHIGSGESVEIQDIPEFVDEESAFIPIEIKIIQKSENNKNDYS